MAVPTPPPDASGGFMTLQYTDGTDTHRSRIHVLPFSTAHFIIGGGTPSVDVDDGNHDYAYQPDRPAGMEAGISDTFQAYVNVIKALFAPAWTFTLQSLWQNNGGVLTEVFPVPNVAPIVGTNGNGAPAGQARAIEQIYNLRTSGGKRGRIIAIGPSSGVSLSTPYAVSTALGTPTDKALMTYLTGQATAVVGHDGQKFMASGNLTFAVNRRLRRHYGYA